MNNNPPSETPPGQSDDGQDDTMTTGETPSGPKERSHPTNIAKACDICKLRKVKCSGGTHCRACRIHGIRCEYSYLTRNQLVERTQTRHGSGSGDRSASGSEGWTSGGGPANGLTVETNVNDPLPWLPNDNTIPPSRHPTADTATFLSIPEMKCQFLPPLASNPELPLTQVAYDWSGTAWLGNAPMIVSPEPRARLQSFRGTPSMITVHRLETDAFGNAGLILANDDEGRNTMEHWGVTSYVGLQDILARMLQVKAASFPLGFGSAPFPLDRGKVPLHREFDVWRWGCADYVFHEHLDVQDMSVPDPMFLPSVLAQRFLNNYIDIVHPLFPILDTDVLRLSISQAYGPGRLPSSTQTPYNNRLDRARDMLVLAFGAQVVAGDGDVECPRDIAWVWSEVFKQHAFRIMMEQNAFQGGADLIQLWVVYAAFSRSYGNGGDELMAISTAARLITRMGLHRRSAHELVGSHVHSYRMLFAVSFYTEKWACLCYGAPTTMIWSAEADDIVKGLPECTGTRHLLYLGRLMDDVQSLFESIPSRTKQTSLSYALDLHDRLLEFRATLEREYDVFEQMDSGLAEHFRSRDVQTIFVQFTVYGLYLQLRMLVLLPMLEQTTWQALHHPAAAIRSTPQLANLSSECEKVAAHTIQLFEEHIQIYSETSELSLSCILLLYAVSIIYMAALGRSDLASRREHTSLVRSAVKTLERYHHPAATLAEAMCKDLLVNLLCPQTESGQIVRKESVEQVI